VISNSADALDKIKYMVLTNKASSVGMPPYEIRIRADPEKKLIQIRDGGIGMTREDLINCLGKIANSGTRSIFFEVSLG